MIVKLFALCPSNQRITPTVRLSERKPRPVAPPPIDVTPARPRDELEPGDDRASDWKPTSRKISKCGGNSGSRNRNPIFTRIKGNGLTNRCLASARRRGGAGNRVRGPAAV
jgi:hypothetical protein